MKCSACWRPVCTQPVPFVMARVAASDFRHPRLVLAGAAMKKRGRTPLSMHRCGAAHQTLSGSVATIELPGLQLKAWAK
jgi:hypothetical protein